MLNYLQSIMSFGDREEDLFRLRQQHMGTMNKDKTIYFVNEDNKDVGFFAQYRWWLEYLYFADICGYTPVIRAGDHFVYRERCEKGCINNAFEYYFGQPSGIGIREAYQSSNVVFSETKHRKMVEFIILGKYSCYYYNKQYLRMMARVARKYLKFNDMTKKYVYDGIKELGIGDGKTLGVHIRGTDFRKKYNDHPVFVTEEEAFFQIDILLSEHGYDKVFLATDDNRILYNFQQRYKEKMCSYPHVLRSGNDQSVAFKKDNRKYNQYMLGLEVIRDMYTLSVCEGFVCGMSQVSVCAQINKLARGERYQNFVMIDKGVYKNSRLFHR